MIYATFKVFFLARCQALHASKDNPKALQASIVYYPEASENPSLTSFITNSIMKTLTPLLLPWHRPQGMQSLSLERKAKEILNCAPQTRSLGALINS